MTVRHLAISTLIAHMVEQEVLWSRKEELDEFGTGLDSLGLLTVIMQNPDVCLILLCSDENAEVGPVEFDHCLSHPEVPDDFVQAQTYEWFNTYISENPKSDSFPGGCRLKALLHFSTGIKFLHLERVFHTRYQFSFLPDDDQHQLAIAQACFGYFKLPTVHSSMAKFVELMDMALKYEGTGFAMF